MRVRAAAALVSVAALFGASSCAVTVQNLPMPKPGIGGPGYTLHATFRDALNLPDHAHVRIGGSDIGTVTAISTTNFIADVQMRIRDDIRLPTGTTVELRQATPLGDMFVAMTLPTAAQAGPDLKPGATIGLDRTGTAASVEQLMMSIAMLVNGGGINQAAQITAELNSMFGGRAPQLAHLLTELTTVITDLNKRTGDIDSTLNGMNSLTGELARHKTELGAAADTFPKLLGLFNENNQRIVDLTTKVATTMDAMGDFTDTTGPQFLSLFDSIQKLMNGFTQMGDNFTQALSELHAMYPPLMASLRGPVLAVAATVSYLSVGALTDPKGSRWPEVGDVPAFIGSLAQVLAKVFGRVTSPPQPVPGIPSGTKNPAFVPGVPSATTSPAIPGTSPSTTNPALPAPIPGVPAQGGAR
ncbi:MCE family protein [Nocardia macrotermitis]|uniref:Lipoprotein LprN n=1 Tax=Nocardia macrotermitis TaxID=2585198 RepID=A0A7K0D0D2_9NOCA|nr:MCE family protein [Nocardia macrotermitis]MQY19196.1 Lipoprotein LprN [Nocardia macrotermitis]